LRDAEDGVIEPMLDGVLIAVAGVPSADNKPSVLSSFVSFS
jgi:hypothetical protein